MARYPNSQQRARHEHMVANTQENDDEDDGKFQSHTISYDW